MSMPDYEVLPNGENSLCVKLVATADVADLQQYIHALASKLKTELNGLSDLIPTTESVTLVFTNAETLLESTANLKDILTEPNLEFNHTSSLHQIDVCYDLRLAPDLAEVARRLGLSQETVIQQHLGAEYRLDMLGFLPGYLYLSGLPESLHIPRKDTPALSVPAGSVAIAGNQSGLYSLSSPGGWWVIGQTADRLFHAELEPPIKIQPMDRIRFRRISFEEWQQRHGN